MTQAAATDQIFRFNTKLDQTILLGRKARNIRELLEGLQTVPGSSIYYHTHKFLQQHQFLSPEPPNDFAYWIENVLNESALGERMSSVDIIQFGTIADLRARFVGIAEDYLRTSPRIVESPPGEEFHFMGLQTFVFKTRYFARTLPEFVECLRNVSIYSIYYHVFDARLRLGREENDFSIWFRAMGHPQLANQLKSLDPYTQTLDGLRKRIIALVGRNGQD